MSLTTPSVIQIKNLIITQIESQLNQTIPALPVSFTRLLAKVIAGVYIVLWKQLGFMFKQWFVSKATWDYIDINSVLISPLIEWGVLVGEGTPRAAEAAEYTVEITVENQIDSLVAGTQLTSTKNRVVYITKTDVALSAATVSVDIQAVDDASDTGGLGTIGNLEIGDIVSFVNPEKNVARATEVTVEILAGIDGEIEDEYRQRVISKFQAKPQGGATADYSDWGLDVLGIIAIYPYPGDPGEVDVYAEANTDINADGIPTAGQITSVEEAIEFDVDGLASRRPITALPNVLPITRTAVDIDIIGLTADDLISTKADINTASTLYFLSRTPYIAGLSSSPRKDKITINSIISAVNNAVEAANGSFTSLTAEIAAAPITTKVLDPGEKAKLGTLLYDGV